ncbi:hypothetical protein Tco_1040621, partial [Tanacetum coccineum]
MIVENDMVKLVVDLKSFGTGYSKGDKNEAKTDKAKHENVKSVKSQSQQKVNPDKVKVKAEADIKEILNEPT